MDTRHRLTRVLFSRLDGGARARLRIEPGSIYAPLLSQWFGDCLGGSWQMRGNAATAEFPLPGALTLEELKNTLLLLRDSILVVPRREIVQSAGLETPPPMHALATNFVPGAGGNQYTPIGQMEYDAKYLHNGKARRKLSKCLAGFVNRHPLLRQAQAIVPVPQDPGKPKHLPNRLAEEMAEICGAQAEIGRVRKRRRTGPIKTLSLNDKIDALRGAFAPLGKIEAKGYIVIDDLIQSGVTMMMTMKVLLDSGAEWVAGLACVKSMRSDDNIGRPGQYARQRQPDCRETIWEP